MPSSPVLAIGSQASPALSYDERAATYSDCNATIWQQSIVPGVFSFCAHLFIHVWLTAARRRASMAIS